MVLKLTRFGQLINIYTDIKEDIIDFIKKLISIQFSTAVREKLDNDDEFLSDILSYHLVEGNVSAKDLPEQTELTTLEGSPLHVNLYHKSQFFKVAKIIFTKNNFYNLDVVHILKLKSS